MKNQNANNSNRMARRIFSSFIILTVAVLAIAILPFFLFLVNNPAATKGAETTLLYASDLLQRQYVYDVTNVDKVTLQSASVQADAWLGLRVAVISPNGVLLSDSRGDTESPLPIRKIYPYQLGGNQVNEFYDEEGKSWTYSARVLPQRFVLIVASPKPMPAPLLIVFKEVFALIWWAVLLAMLSSLLLARLCSRWIYPTGVLDGQYGNCRPENNTSSLIEAPLSSVQGDEFSVESRVQLQKYQKGNNRENKEKIENIPIHITRSVMNEIADTIGNMMPERGGMLGGHDDDGVITFYHFDKTANRSGATYSPDVKTINRLLKEDWNPNGVGLKGFVHSHPDGYKQPSPGDKVYAEAILRANPHLDRLLLPIMQVDPAQRTYDIYGFAALRDGFQVRFTPLEIDIEEKTQTKGIIQNAEVPRTFQRVQSAYDLQRMKHSRVIVIGTGGAIGFVEDLARTGIAEWVLIDPDVVGEENISTQNVYHKDIDKLKVECLADCLREINPNAHIRAIPDRLESISDDQFQHLAFAPFGSEPPAQTLICGLTDSFEAQARVNRLALKFGLPSLCAQVYREGRGAEITFTYPGITPACHRCVLSSRYKAYLELGYQNDVTSNGTPIFATTRLNALKGFVALAILHHGTRHPRWGGLLERIGNRNLIAIRMDPDIESTLGLKWFEQAFGEGDAKYILFDEAVWRPQEPDNVQKNGRQTCPDCLGTGNLLDAKGRFRDTRNMPLILEPYGVAYRYRGYIKDETSRH